VTVAFSAFPNIGSAKPWKERRANHHSEVRMRTRNHRPNGACNHTYHATQPDMGCDYGRKNSVISVMAPLLTYSQIGQPLGNAGVIMTSAQKTLVDIVFHCA
jgi:hypothetical protein